MNNAEIYLNAQKEAADNAAQQTADRCDELYTQLITGGLEVEFEPEVLCRAHIDAAWRDSATYRQFVREFQAGNTQRRVELNNAYEGIKSNWVHNHFMPFLDDEMSGEVAGCFGWEGVA